MDGHSVQNRPPEFATFQEWDRPSGGPHVPACAKPKYHKDTADGRIYTFLGDEYCSGRPGRFGGGGASALKRERGWPEK